MEDLSEFDIKQVFDGVIVNSPMGNKQHSNMAFDDLQNTVSQTI